MLSGRLSLVTGGGSGIGRAICQIFAREGARVIVADRNVEAAKETEELLSGSEHISLPLEVSSSESVQSMFSEISQRYSRPACSIVNSAGITKDTFLLKMDDKQFEEVINVNLKGTYLVTKYGATELVNAGLPGSVVNLSSIIGKTGNIGQSNYAASKGGVELFSKSVAKELARYNIRCNVIRPGFIETPLTGTIPNKVKEMLLSTIVQKRFGTPEEIAEVAAFLSSDKASYMTGACIDVTGGYGM